jgi:hypothetical protein
MRARQNKVFVCSAIINSKIISSIIEASSSEEASAIFSAKNTTNPLDISGPLYQNVCDKKDDYSSIKFSGETKKAIYNDWIVNAMMLNEPANCAYIIFLNRVDCKKMQAPKNITIVKHLDLKFLQ